MTDKMNDSCCEYWSGTNKTCEYVYHSCANIKITGNQNISGYSHQNHPLWGIYSKNESAIWNNISSSWFLMGEYKFNDSLCQEEIPEKPLGYRILIKIGVLSLVMGIGFFVCFIIYLIYLYVRRRRAPLRIDGNEELIENQDKINTKNNNELLDDEDDL